MTSYESAEIDPVLILQCPPLDLRVEASVPAHLFVLSSAVFPIGVPLRLQPLGAGHRGRQRVLSVSTLSTVGVASRLSPRSKDRPDLAYF